MKYAINYLLVYIRNKEEEIDIIDILRKVVNTRTPLYEYF
jgi:hypothetical protein